MLKLIQQILNNSIIEFTPTNWEILLLLEKEGYLKILNKSESYIHIKRLSNFQIKRISLPSRRVFIKHHQLSSGYKQGLGRFIIKTSKGYLTELDLIKNKIGGELLFKIF